MFERETRREKILEARNKEIRLKEKTKGILGLSAGAAAAAGGGGKPGGGGGMSSMAISALTGKGKMGLGTKSKPSPGDGGGGPISGDALHQEEDPIVKAEREFLDMIKKEQEARLEQRRSKMENNGVENTKK